MRGDNLWYSTSINKLKPPIKKNPIILKAAVKLMWMGVKENPGLNQFQSNFLCCQGCKMHASGKRLLLTHEF